MDEPVTTAPTGLIYACVEEGGQFVKIGWTSTIEQAYARWWSLQIGNPRRLAMHLLGDGSREDEARLHSQLREYAVRGEWFRVEAEVEDLLDGAILLPVRSAGGGDGRPPTERKAAEQWLIQALSAGPRPARDVYEMAAEAGHSRGTIRRVADAIGVLRDPSDGGSVCRWTLPLGDHAAR